jgi:hypothetical protein
MLPIIDYKTNLSDDLCIENGDIAIETDLYTSTVKTGERRASARYDDFPLNDISAGLERYLYQNIESSKSEILYDLRNVLKANHLFLTSDFDIIIPNTDNKFLQVFIKLKTGLTDSDGFRVIVDQLNQNSYR